MIKYTSFNVGIAAIPVKSTAYLSHTTTFTDEFFAVKTSKTPIQDQIALRYLQRAESIAALAEKQVGGFPVYKDDVATYTAGLASSKIKDYLNVITGGLDSAVSVPYSTYYNIVDQRINQKMAPWINGEISAHDSAEKLEFGGRIFAKNGIYVCTDVKSSLKPITYQGVNIYLLPFIKPIDVNFAFNTTVKTYSEALSEVIERMAVDPSKTNILLAHQMVLPVNGPLLVGGSESALNAQDGVAIGDVTSVSASLFSMFDYVALGHGQFGLGFVPFGNHPAKGGRD